MCYERKSVHTIEEIESILKEKVLSMLSIPKRNKDNRFTILNNEEIYTLSDRYKTFFVKGYKCSTCGIEGSFFALERDKKNCHKNSVERYHLNLYGYDKDGNEILMTKDHIIPKSLGGENKVENYQTMCKLCNKMKGNDIL